MAGIVHRRPVIWAALFAIALTLFCGGVSRATTAASKNDCQDVTQPKIIHGTTPILFVHGINSDHSTWDGQTPVDGTSENPLTYIQTALGPSQVTGYTFDWSEFSGFTSNGKVSWVTDPPPANLGDLLARAITCVASHAGHKVIIIAHSMGGLLTEYASKATGTGTDIAAVFTLGTPYQGSWLASAAIGQGPDQTTNGWAQTLESLCSFHNPAANQPSPSPSVKVHRRPVSPIDTKIVSFCHLLNERNDSGIAAMRLNPPQGGGWEKLQPLPAGIPWYPLAASVQGVSDPISPVRITERLNYVGDGVVSPTSQLAGGSKPTLICQVDVTVRLRGRPVRTRQPWVLDAESSPCFHAHEPYDKTLLSTIISTIRSKHMVPTAAILPAGLAPEVYVHNGYELGSLYRYPNFPVSIGLDNQDYISGLHWQRVTQSAATAMGTLNFDSCTPDCASGSYQTYPVELLVSAPQQCEVKVYKPNSSVYNVMQAFVYNKIYVKSLGGSPPASLVGDTASLPPACGNTPSSTGPTSQPGPSGSPDLTITNVQTYQQGALVYFSIHYNDPDHIAQGFGFVGVKGSGWAEEQHPFSSPSYGIVGPDSIDYPFNLGCGTAQQYPSYVKAWIYGSVGVRSKPVVIHLTCTGQAG